MKSLFLFIKEVQKNYQLQLIAVLIFGLFNSFFQGIGILLIIPLIELYTSETQSASWIVNFIEQFGSVKDLNFLLITYFAVLSLIALFKAGYTYFSTSVITRLSAGYAVDAFKYILRADWSFFIKHQPSRLVNLFKTESRSVRSLTMFFFRLIQSGMLIIIQLSLAFLISWKLTLLSVAVLGILYLTQTLFFKKNFNIGHQLIQINERVQQLVTEVFQGIKFLKLHDLEDRKQEEFSKIHFDARDNELKKVKLDVVADLVFTVMGALVIVGVIYFGLTFKWVTISGILVLLVLLSRSISQVQSFSKTVRFLFNQLPSFEKFHILVHEAQKQQKQFSPVQEVSGANTIRFENVHFSYDNTPLIKGQNHHFEKGKSYLLFGPSGAGKTTTLDLISGLIYPQKGSVNPRPIPKFSYVLQESMLFAGSIKENITLGEHYSEKQIKNVLEQVGLAQKVAALSQGIDTVLNENASNFSGGEKQRLSLARALITNPSVLLLDEFTSALDAQTESQVMESINKIKHDKIVIVVSHRERTKDWVDEVIGF